VDDEMLGAALREAAFLKEKAQAGGMSAWERSLMRKMLRSAQAEVSLRGKAALHQTRTQPSPTQLEDTSTETVM
jgi:hypothetical protein